MIKKTTKFPKKGKKPSPRTGRSERDQKTDGQKRGHFWPLFLPKTLSLDAFWPKTGVFGDRIKPKKKNQKGTRDGVFGQKHVKKRENTKTPSLRGIRREAPWGFWSKLTKSDPRKGVGRRMRPLLTSFGRRMAAHPRPRRRLKRRPRTEPYQPGYSWPFRPKRAKSPFLAEKGSLSR